ncbi:MAG: hypothetical protein Tsb0020_44420 [Haliangiales bacterium]
MALLGAWLGPPSQAAAQAPPTLPAEDEATARQSREAALDPEFGPRLVIEDIEVVGETSTARRLILRTLPIAVGDALRAGDPRFRQARFKLLATGYFRTAELALRKGSRPGHVVLMIEVEDRGTVILNSAHFGTSSLTPWWAGLDVSESNLLGTGVGVGVGGMYAAASELDGARSQRGAQLRVSDPALLGSRFGAHGELFHTRASEPVRVRGEPDESTISDYCTLPYQRWGGRAGMGVELAPLSQLSVEMRVEGVERSGPLGPQGAACALADGTLGPTDVQLEPGRSRIVSVRAGVDRDTRPDPILPDRGTRLLILAEFGSTALGSDYGFAVLLASYSRWWPLRGRKQVLAVHLSGGMVLGRAARFDRLHVADFNRLLTPRAYGLLTSTSTTSLDVFGTGADALDYGEYGGSAVFEYTYRLFRSRRYIYGGDVFVGAGIWGLGAREQVPPRPGDAAFPVDVLLDAGLRIDTEIGVFELTFANALGRLPL